MCASGYKSDAIEKFRANLNDFIKVLAATTLAARDIGKSTYPLSIISWDSLTIKGDDLLLNIKKNKAISENELHANFESSFNLYLAIAKNSDTYSCTKICRGHTAMILLQRFFAMCLYEVIYQHDLKLAQHEAKNFSNIPESTIASSFSEAWVRSITNGKAKYPQPLLKQILLSHNGL